MERCNETGKMQREFLTFFSKEGTWKECILVEYCNVRQKGV